MKADANRLPSYWAGILAVWKRNYLHFRRLWLMNFFWIVLEPVLLLVAIGYGLGSFVPSMQGVAYADFFFPSVLCISSMMVSFFESTYGNYAKLHSHRTYSTLILTSLEPRQVVLGEILWSATKGTISAAGVAVIAGIFGHLDNIMLIPSAFAVFLSAILFSALGMVATSYVKTNDEFIFPTSALIIPMSLFSGTYFPIEQLPFGLKYVSYLLPLTHSVALVRGLLLGQGETWWQALIHVTILLFIAIVLTRIAIRRISEKLIS